MWLEVGSVKAALSGLAWWLTSVAVSKPSSGYPRGCYANEVLAHLRACNEVWGGYYIMTILTQDNPTIKAMNPRTWIKDTDYLEQEFLPSLRAFTKQRRRLLAVLEPLPPKDWTRTNTLIGAGKPLQQTLMSHADGLARHERAHLKQIERTLNTLQGALGTGNASR